MKLPFTHAGRRGIVDARVARNKGAAASGFDLFGFPFSRTNLAGFPTLTARVSSSGAGYRRFFAWIQLVEFDLAGAGRARTVVDVPPALTGLGLPFAALGDCPTLFDAPATTIRAAGFFTADAFLCAVSMVDRKKPIRPLTGFRWGYSIDAASRIRIHAPERAAAASWNSRRTLLKRTCPRWAFAPARL